MDDWDSKIVFDCISEIREDPTPSGDWRFERKIEDAAESDWVPEIMFQFQDGDYLVWGGYWVGPVDMLEAELWWIDRIKAPMEAPIWFGKRNDS